MNKKRLKEQKAKLSPKLWISRLRSQGAKDHDSKQKVEARKRAKISYLTQNLGPKTLMLLLFPNRRLKSVRNS
jgi:hypothetical protein